MTKKRDKRPSGAGIAFDFSRDGFDSSVVAYTGLTRYKPFFTCPVYEVGISSGFFNYNVDLTGQPYTPTTFIKKIEVYAKTTNIASDCCVFVGFDSNCDITQINGDGDGDGDGDCIITIPHNLGEKYVFVDAFLTLGGFSNEKIIPDAVTLIDSNTLEVNLTSLEPHFGGGIIVKCVGDSSQGGYMTSFVDGDLTSNVLQVTHSLGEKYVFVDVYDDTDNKIIPDEITLIDQNTLEIDLSSFTPLVGTWHVIVKNCIEPQQPTLSYQLISTLTYSSPNDFVLPWYESIALPNNAYEEAKVVVSTNNRPCNKTQIFPLDPPPPVEECCYSQTFTNDDLFTFDGQAFLSVPHNRGFYTFIEVYDENDQKIIPDQIISSVSFGPTLTSTDIELTSFVPISGTWNVIVMCCSSAPTPGPA